MSSPLIVRDSGKELPEPIEKNIMVLQLLSEVDFSFSDLARKIFWVGFLIFKLKSKTKNKKLLRLYSGGYSRRITFKACPVLHNETLSKTKFHKLLPTLS